MKTQLAVAIAAASFAVACSKPYVVVREAVPNPFVHAQCRLAVADVATNKLIVGDEPDARYAADKSPEQQASYQQDKAAFSSIFRDELAQRHPSLVVPAPAAGPNVFLMRASFTHWEPGFEAVIVSKPAEAQITVDIYDASGQKLYDEIRTKAKVTGSFASGSRMRDAARVVARYTSAYIDDRFLCAPQ